MISTGYMYESLANAKIEYMNNGEIEGRNPSNYRTIDSFSIKKREVTSLKTIDPIRHYKKAGTNEFDQSRFEATLNEYLAQISMFRKEERMGITVDESMFDKKKLSILIPLESRETVKGSLTNFLNAAPGNIAVHQKRQKTPKPVEINFFVPHNKTIARYDPFSDKIITE